MLQNPPINTPKQTNLTGVIASVQMILDDHWFWRATDWLTELWFYVPLDTKYVISRDVPQANLLAWYGKTKPNTTKAHITNHKKCTTTQNKHKNLKPSLDASYNIQPGNGEGLFLFRRFINLSIAHLKLNSIMLSWSQTWSQTCSELEFGLSCTI